MARNKDANWTLPNEAGPHTYDSASLAVLMDIRDELKTLNNVFRCGQFLDIPRKLDRIIANTAKKPKLKVVKARRVA